MLPPNARAAPFSGVQLRSVHGALVSRLTNHAKEHAFEILADAIWQRAPRVLAAPIVRVSGEAYARIYPFKGAFFLGAGVGAMQMKGSLEQTVQAFHQDQHASAHAYARSIYVSPQIGFLWLTRSGISFGTDLGAQIPIVTTDVTYDAEKYGLVTPVEGKGSLASAMRFVSSMPVPVVNLLRIGYVL